MTRGGLALAAGAFALPLIGACSKRTPDPALHEEVSRRETFARSLLVVDGGPAPALRVGSSTEVHFEEGFSLVQFEPVDDAFGHAFRWMGQHGRVRLRTHGDTPMHLRIAGWLNEKAIHEKATTMAFIDRQEIGPPVRTDEKGIFVIDTTLDPELFRGKTWVDLVIVPNSVAYHWADPPELKLVVLFDFVWRPEPTDAGAP